MEKTLDFANSSDLYRKIATLNLTSTQRSQARAAAVSADTVVNLITRLLDLLHLRSPRSA